MEVRAVGYLVGKNNSCSQQDYYMHILQTIF
jgi:hypothetical protein